MKIQCADGIITLFENEVELSKATMQSLKIVELNLSMQDVRARKPMFSTPATMAEVQAAADAQKQGEQAKQVDASQQRAAWLSGLTDAELLDMQQRAWDAEMTLAQDVEAELVKRNLSAKAEITVDTGDFAQYVEARMAAEREGRLDQFEDGIGTEVKPEPRSIPNPITHPTEHRAYVEQQKREDIMCRHPLTRLAADLAGAIGQQEREAQLWLAMEIVKDARWLHPQDEPARSAYHELQDALKQTDAPLPDVRKFMQEVEEGFGDSFNPWEQGQKTAWREAVERGEILE